MHLLFSGRDFRILATLFLLFVILNTKAEEPGKSLVITHPTISTLERVKYLLHEGIFPISEDMELILVYHSAENYDYTKSKAWIDTAGMPRPCRWYKLDAPLGQKEIFAKNRCTERFSELFKSSSGIIFFGGPDIPPGIYGEEMNLLTVVSDPYRHYWETSLLYHLLINGHSDDNKPLLEQNKTYTILGICLGMQTMNVACGGSMIQDIPSEIYKAGSVEEVLGMTESMIHRNYLKNFALDPDVSSGYIHEISFEENVTDYLEMKVPDAPLSVLSSHHQAVDILGSGLVVLARSADQQVVEMICHDTYPNILGVQFHPEVPMLYEEAESLRNEASLRFHRTLWKQFAHHLNQKENTVERKR